MNASTTSHGAAIPSGVPSSNPHAERERKEAMMAKGNNAQKKETKKPKKDSTKKGAKDTKKK